MAPVQIEAATSYRPLAVAASHVALSVWLSVTVGRSLYRSRYQLSPAQDTRQRSASRSRNLPIFAGLAVLSLASAAYGALQYATLSYRAWASERDIPVPARYYGTTALHGDTTEFHIARWLDDTPLYLDAAEILAEKARRFWWAQQIDLSLVSWTMLLSIEGRRRNIPLLWCYQVLAQLVSLPYAQNLFFLALIFNPSPLPQNEAGTSSLARLWNRVSPSKPTQWVPHQFVYMVVLLLNLSAIGLAPLFVGTPAFQTITTTARLLSFIPVTLHRIIPSSWGILHEKPHDAYKSYSGLFRLILAASVLLHGKATIVGLAYNAPESHVHRHSIHLPFDVEKRSAWERTTSAFGRILTATSDHPVVRKIGWDVLISAASLGLWAAVRVTDVLHVLTYTNSEHSHTEAEDEDEGQARSDAKPRGVKAALRSATGTDNGSGHRRRGRHQAAKTQPEPEPEAEDDSAYVPTPSEIAAVAEGDVLPGAGEEGWESAALAWGLAALGGLGVASAAVHGGECIAR